MQRSNAELLAEVHKARDEGRAYDALEAEVKLRRRAMDAVEDDPRGVAIAESVNAALRPRRRT
jgi:hypothetical protein